MQVLKMSLALSWKAAMVGKQPVQCVLVLGSFKVQFPSNLSPSWSMPPMVSSPLNASTCSKRLALVLTQQDCSVYVRLHLPSNLSPSWCMPPMVSSPVNATNCNNRNYMAVMIPSHPHLNECAIALSFETVLVHTSHRVLPSKCQHLQKQVNCILASFLQSCRHLACTQWCWAGSNLVLEPSQCRA